MKKQTKVLVTLSAAALLALGFSAVSFAEGWDNSTGSWQYLDKDGEPVTNEWKTSNGQKFYLNDDGVMATDSLIEDTTTSNSKTYYYYVDANGAMVTNTWKAVALDGDENTDTEAEYWWYYFGADGKAYTSSENRLTKSKIKTINGLKYAFNEEGHMVYGWIQDGNVGDMTQQDGDEDAWKNSAYYFNGWNDGHAANGWLQLDVVDNDSDETDKTYWFYFDSNGKKKTGRKKINGKYYHLAADGHMVDEWDYGTANGSFAGHGTASTPSMISYLNGDGSERKNKWVWAIPDENWINKDYEDDEYSWFYFNKSGKLVSNTIKKVNGKKYAFDKYGRMLTGVVYSDPGTIVANINSDNYAPSTDDGSGMDDFTRAMWTSTNLVPISTAGESDKGLFYFSEDEKKDGSQKKGYVTLSLDDGDYQFYFDAKSGKAHTGYLKKISKFTVNGLVLKPTNDDDNNYAGISFTGKFPKMDLDIIKVGDTLINKSGTIVKASKNGVKYVKDENDTYYVVDAKGEVLGVYGDKDALDKNKTEGEKWSTLGGDAQDTWAKDQLVDVD